ncbi:hypothetical protein Tco_0155446 [Tanacetum coccineum]
MGVEWSQGFNQRSKPKPEVKAKASVCKRILSKEDHSKKKPEVDYDSSSNEGGPDSDSDSFDEEDHSKKQKKLNRKRNDSDSDSSSIDRETIERMINKLQKKFKKESDEECVPRNGKNKEKQLTSEKAAYQEYLSIFPSFHARTTPLLYLDLTNFERFSVVRTRPAVKNWTSYLMRQRQELELKKRVVGLLDLNSDWTETEVKEAEGFIGSVENSEKELATICSERVRLEDLLRQANSDYHGDGKFIELQEKGDSDVNQDDDNADSRNDDDVGGDGNGNEDDAGNGDDEDGGCKSIEKQVDAMTKEVDATTKEVDSTTKEVDATTKEVDATTKENVGDTLNAIAEVAEDMRRNNEGTVTPERLVTRHSKASPSPNKRMVKPSSYLLSPYMNKKTTVLPKINSLIFMIGASLFAMQRDKIETVFETTSCEEKALGSRLNMETLSLGLCIDANVVDCWAEILNYEDRFRKDGSLSRHFFPTGCIIKSMFDGTLSTYEEKWKSFVGEV